MRVRSAPRKKEMCPGVWPGVWMICQFGSAPVSWSPAEIRRRRHWPARIHGREQRHQSASCSHVRRRVLLLTGEVRRLEFVSVDGYIPKVREFARGAYVVEVPVREDDGNRWRFKVLFRPGTDERSRVGNSCINQCPVIIGVADSKDIYESNAQPFYAFCYMIDRDDVVFGYVVVGHRLSGRRIRMQALHLLR